MVPRLLVLLTLAACGDWPLHAHLPDDSDALVVPGEDLAGLVAVDWTMDVASEPDDVPADALALSLDFGAGAVVTGTLDGSGWSDSATPAEIGGDGCDTATATPFDGGAYREDVDFVVVDLDGGGLLCATAEVSPANHGWDLLLFPVDGCGVPGPAIQGEDGEPLGAGLGGASGAWNKTVGAGRFGLMLAAYDPDDPDIALDWRLGVSLLEAPPGAVPVCPALPAVTP
jgi:hypothetical protein